ncbi:uncharacterized protein TNCV_4832801 [Trichonephila clavipes]|nr:uncharacterized protein TNCV_4832801 [Trichonephila clavipes]
MQTIRISAQTQITRASLETPWRKDHKAAYLRLGDFDDFKFRNSVFFFQKKKTNMSRRKQRSAFDQVSEFDRGRIVAYRDCGLSFREIGSRVGRNQTTVMRICDPWMQESTKRPKISGRIKFVVDRILLSALLHMKTGKLCA